VWNSVTSPDANIFKGIPPNVFTSLFFLIIENITCNEIMEFQRTGHYNLVYMKTKELGWKETQGTQWNRIVEQSQVLKIWENYITELNDRPNRPKTLEV
jgi:hypothetical protein